MTFRALALFCVAFVLASLLNVSAIGSSPAAATTVAVRGAYDMVFSSNGSRLYTSNWDTDSVSEINPSTGAVLRTFEVQYQPGSIVISPDGRTLVTGHAAARGLTVITLSTGATREVNLGSRVDDIMYSTDGTKLYFTSASYWVGVVGAPAFSSYTTIETPGPVTGLNRQPGTNFVWLAESSPAPFHIYRLDLSNNRVTTRSASGSEPGFDMAFPAGNERVFGPTGSYSTAWVLDLGSTPRKWRTTLGSSDYGARNLITTLDRTLVLGTTGGNNVVVIDPLTERTVEEIAIGEPQFAIAARPGTTEIWVSTENSVQSFAAPTRSVPTAGTDVTVTRISGAERYATAAAISRQAFPEGAATVYLASGLGYADALSAAPAAAVENAPLLLSGATLPASTRAELRRLAPTEVVIIGGTSALPSGIVSAVRSALPGVTVRRLSGADRYATSRAIVADTWPGTSSTTSIASGRNFHDALSVAPLAARLDSPLLLIDGLRVDGTSGRAIDTASSLAIDRLRSETKLVVGDSKTVTNDLWDDIVGYPFTPETERRLWGSDRYRTNQHVNGYGFESADTVYLASGLNYPDALAGSVLAGIGDDPLYLVPTNCVPRQVLYDIERLGATNVVLLGGTSVLSSRVASLRSC